MLFFKLYVFNISYFQLILIRYNYSKIGKLYVFERDYVLLFYSKIMYTTLLLIYKTYLIKLHKLKELIVILNLLTNQIL